MTEPTSGTLPWCTPRFPCLFCEIEAIFFLTVKKVVQLLCCAFVEDDGVFFVVPTKASSVKVGASDSTYLSIHHDNFGVVKARSVHPNVATGFHQFVCIVETTVGGQWNIALCAEHDFYLDSSLSSLFQCFLQLMIKRKVGIDNLYAVFCAVDGRQIKLPNDGIACSRFAVDDADRFMTGCFARVFL